MKLVIYFLVAYIINFQVIPIITTFIKKSFYYKKIKNICKVNNYTMISNYLIWIFSSVKNEDPEMFIKTDKAIYSIKNYGFYKTPNYFVFLDKNTVEIQIVRMIFYIGFVFLKQIKKQNTNYDEAEKHFEISKFPVINIILFCPKCVQLITLVGNSLLTYKNYVNTKCTFKIFKIPILKMRSIIKSPFIGFTDDKPVPDMKGIETVDLKNGDMIYGAYVYNIKSFMKERLNSSDFLVHS